MQRAGGGVYGRALSNKDEDVYKRPRGRTELNVAEKQKEGLTTVE